MRTGPWWPMTPRLQWMGWLSASRRWVGAAVAAALVALLGWLVARTVGVVVAVVVGGSLYLFVTWAPVWERLPPQQMVEARRRVEAENARRAKVAAREERRRQRANTFCQSPANRNRHLWKPPEHVECALCGQRKV